MVSLCFMLDILAAIVDETLRLPEAYLILEWRAWTGLDVLVCCCWPYRILLSCAR